MTIADEQRVPFNRPYMTGRELHNIADAHSKRQLSGDGSYTRACHEWLQEQTGAAAAMLTPSCTAALEMSALLLDLRPGDEVIMPSYTFVSTANAFTLRGAVPVFVDIRPDTLNLDEALIEGAITSRTKAICIVHYAGVAAEMDTIMSISRRYGLAVVEDAAQAVLSTYKGRPLGSIGDFGTFSFHETKNITSGEGGALLLRDNDFAERAEIIREKGTNRARFFRGQEDKYTWVDVGSSYLPGEVTAAFLKAQLDAADDITRQRLTLWDRYNSWAARHEEAGLLRRPVVPDYAGQNAHMFYVLLPTAGQRTHFIKSMDARGINTVFHYVPLHSSPAGLTRCRIADELPVTDDIGQRLVRMPLWIGLEPHLDRVLASAEEVLAEIS